MPGLPGSTCGDCRLLFFLQAGHGLRPAPGIPCALFFDEGFCNKTWACGAAGTLMLACDIFVISDARHRLLSRRHRAGATRIVRPLFDMCIHSGIAPAIFRGCRPHDTGHAIDAPRVRGGSATGVKLSPHIGRRRDDQPRYFELLLQPDRCRPRDRLDAERATSQMRFHAAIKLKNVRYAGATTCPFHSAAVTCNNTERNFRQPQIYLTDLLLSSTLPQILHDAGFHFHN